MFAYCRSNPVNLRDPLGYWSFPTWEEIEEWAEKAAEWVEEAIDDLVQGTIETYNPLGFMLLKKFHYGRNVLNEAPKTEEDASNSGYVKTSQSDDKFHQNNQAGGRNRKYISQDGHFEVVYYSNGRLNDTPEDRGTYNIFPANGNFLERYLGHGVFDVLPYLIWGNSPEDGTTIIERIEMMFE